MAYGVLIWKDHSVTPDKTFNVTENSDGTITLTPAGRIIQQGTNMSAVNFNNLETGVMAANVSAVEALRLCNLIQDDIKGVTGVILNTTLTNMQSYPFNGSKKTVAFNYADTRRNADYTLYIEVVESSGGCVGDIIVSDKLINGFKIEYTGSAKSVKLKIYVQGGM